MQGIHDKPVAVAKGSGVSRRPARFTQADVARAVRAIEQIGSNRIVKIDTDGSILILLPPVEKPNGRVDPHQEIIL